MKANKKTFLVLCPVFLVAGLLFFVLLAERQKADEHPEPLRMPLPSLKSDLPAEETPLAAAAPNPAYTLTSADTELELYKGPVQHVFYHFLIAFPEIARTSNYGKHLGEDCLTPIEFTRSLEELYKNNYVLYDINKMVSADKDSKGKEVLSLAPIKVPKGKKPIILSFDDLNYYAKNRGKGTADRLVLDAKGDLAMATLQTDGTELLTYDNDAVPLLEQFIQDHPDFSPDGTRGTIALTGFDGALGYRVQSGSPNREQEIEAVKPVIKALKEKGWNFASHGYGHLHSRKISLKRLKQDLQKWDSEIESLVGKTQVYIYPYGETVPEKDKKFDAIYKQGFRVFCGVGIKPYLKVTKTHMYMDRANIDGYSLRNHAALLRSLMDSKTVYDPEGRGEETALSEDIQLDSEAIGY